MKKKKTSWQHVFTRLIEQNDQQAIVDHLHQDLFPKNYWAHLAGTLAMHGMVDALEVIAQHHADTEELGTYILSGLSQSKQNPQEVFETLVKKNIVDISKHSVGTMSLTWASQQGPDSMDWLLEQPQFGQCFFSPPHQAWTHVLTLPVANIFAQYPLRAKRWTQKLLDKVGMEHMLYKSDQISPHVLDVVFEVMTDEEKHHAVTLVGEHLTPLMKAFESKTNLEETLHSSHITPKVKKKVM